ncbi:PLP-dependent aminotransferase family protein [Roseomonas sp. E05]|uniref:MocR-like pyridoxine biosynthesis transcription factor PdxR n=1 Tax=Roseomonas sp. E05 TaxID=3046310 RepID=UPI0024BA6004|nr:PLP-dependent aminotransferase family protein [Roseomonas sp. E05]MDJ0387084.1 PLP-dependent aminotransferase family protein [Roseomonas sp. E05]
MGQSGGGKDRVRQRIGEAIKAQIAAGTYRPGARLPSTRALAMELGVSRTTVTAAYEQLLAEGYLETRPGAHTRVARGLRPHAQAPGLSPPAGPARLSAFGQRIAGFGAPGPFPGRQPAIDFRYGDLAAADFPTLAWRRALNAALLHRPDRLRYGDPCGTPALRVALQGYLWRARGLRCEPDQIIVVNGSQQGLDLCARLLLDPGDRAVIEDPCYLLARQTLAAAGARLLPIMVDREGMRTDRLPAAARLAYVTPSHQFPLGSVMSVARRQELLAWAARMDAHVIEDDYDGEFRFDIRPVEALQALSGASRVIYLGTFSKTLSPLLRLGYLVVPAALRPAFATAKRLADRQAPGLEQDALAALIASGAYERHVRRMRRRNAERRAALLAALAAELGDRVAVEGADAGLHLVAWLADLPRRQEVELALRASAQGLGVHPVTPLYDPSAATERPDRAGLILGYASLDEREIRGGVRRLAAVLEEMRAAGPAHRI